MNDVSHVLLSKEGFHECLLPYAKVQAPCTLPWASVMSVSVPPPPSDLSSIKLNAFKFGKS